MARLTAPRTSTESGIPHRGGPFALLYWQTVADTLEIVRPPLNDGECSPDATLDAAPENDRPSASSRALKGVATAVIVVAVLVAAGLIVSTRSADETVEPAALVVRVEPGRILDQRPLVAAQDDTREALVRDRAVTSQIVVLEPSVVEPAPAEVRRPSSDWLPIGFILVSLAIVGVTIDEVRRWRRASRQP
ncbi:MAG: hypothetical protein ACN4GZ_12240 [Acidimicrobiales bacterium]